MRRITKILQNKYRFKSVNLFSNFFKIFKIILKNHKRPSNPEERYIFAYKLLKETICPGFLNVIFPFFSNFDISINFSEYLILEAPNPSPNIFIFSDDI